MKTSVLKPGLLVSLRTSVRGNVTYQRRDLEPDHQTNDGGRRARWETEREIADAAEFEKATEIRGKARSLISGACCASSFGLLCPMDREQALEDAIAEARALVDVFNTKATLTRVEVYILAGRVAQNDVEAARAISAELRDLMADMQEGIKRADPEAIREAANKARALGGMLSQDVSGKVNEAIAQARSAAREIVKRVEKAGESAALVVAELNVQKIQAARFAFLDLEDAVPVETQAPAARPLELPAETDAQPAHVEAQGGLPFDLEI